MYHPSYQYLLALIKKFGKKDRINLVDYGCGNGIVLNLINNDKISKYSGYEVSDSAIAVGKQKWRSKKVSFHKINTKKLPVFDKRSNVDLWLFIGSLQYMADNEIEHIFGQVSKSLSKDGIMAASCVTDHAIYRFLNLYRFFFPNRYINRAKIVALAKKNKLKIKFIKEKGLVVGPLFSHGLVIFFDAMDKLIFRNQGKLGPIGIWAREAMLPIMKLEYKLPIDYGYTLFFILKK